MISKLESYLDKNGISGKELLRITGMSRQRAYYLKNKGIKNWKLASDIAEQLGCKPEQLIGMEEGRGYRSYKIDRNLKKYF
jgi:DNA-binding Xre family transcriptional regulator